MDTFKIRDEHAATVQARIELTEIPTDLASASTTLTGKGKELVIKLGLTGTVTQACVVTLDPIPHIAVDETFHPPLPRG